MTFGDALEQAKAGTLTFTPSCSYELLHEQLIYMRHYKAILEQRAKIEGVDLEQTDGNDKD